MEEENKQKFIASTIFATLAGIILGVVAGVTFTIYITAAPKRTVTRTCDNGVSVQSEKDTTYITYLPAHDECREGK